MLRIVIGILSAVVFSLFSLAATDYYRQAVYAGVPASEFGLSGWTQSFVDRGKAAAQRARLEARRDGPLRDYFPEAPAGWERVEWHRGYDEALSNRKDYSTPEHDEMMAEIESNPTFATLKAVDSAVGAGRDLLKSKRAWVYVRGDKLIILKARFVDPNPKGRGGLFASITAEMNTDFNSSSAPVVKAYHGVAFRKRGSSFRTPRPGEAQRLKAMIGDQLEITVHTNAPMASVGRVLSKIRYADLRELVGAPTGERVTQKQRELTAELRRKEREERLAKYEKTQRIERRLQGMMRAARIRGEQEVCLDFEGKRYCRWVD